MSGQCMSGQCMSMHVNACQCMSMHVNACRVNFLRNLKRSPFVKMSGKALVSKMDTFDIIFMLTQLQEERFLKNHISVLTFTLGRMVSTIKN